LEGLEQKADQYQAYTENAHGFLGDMIGPPLDEGRKCTQDGHD
jgi:hypothetical protein